MCVSLVGSFEGSGGGGQSAVDGGGLGGEARPVAVEVGGEAGDVLGVGVDGVERGPRRRVVR